MNGPSRRDFLRRTASAFGSCWLGDALLSKAASAATMPDFRPKFSFCNETFGDISFAETCDAIARCGYAGVEVAPFTIAQYVTDITVQRRRQLRADAKKAGLEVVGLHWILSKTKGLHLTSPEADIRRRTADYLRELAQCCADLDGEVLVFGSPRQRNRLPGVTAEQAHGYAVEVIERTLPALERTNTVLALEPLSPKITNFMASADEAARVAQAVDSPHCRLTLDCLAMSAEPIPIPETIGRHRERLAHFHANDPNARGPGFGELDFRPILKVLREIGYTGWISVEVFDYSPGPKRLCRESLDYLRKCL